MRIFVTGGTGFIGKSLCSALGQHDLMILTRNPTKLQRSHTARALCGDLSNMSSWKDQLAAFDPEVCLHLAWANLPDYSISNNNLNLQFSLNLFQTLLEIQCKRVVVAGTCAEYGNLTGCVKEDQVPTTQWLFASYKAALRAIGQSMFAQSKTSFVWTRPFYVYGPQQRSTSLIPSTIRSLHMGTQPNIQTPNALQDFIHVDDVAQGLVVLATTDAPSGVYNLGFGQPVLVRDLVNLIARLLNRSLVYEATGEIGQGFWANMEQMRKYTGWAPSISIEKGAGGTLKELKISTPCAA